MASDYSYGYETFVDTHKPIRLTQLAIGVAHRLTEDDEYQGYFIPKGTMVYANAWYVYCCLIDKPLN